MKLNEVRPLVEVQQAADFGNKVAEARLKQIAEVLKQWESGLLYPVEALFVINQTTLTEKP